MKTEEDGFRYIKISMKKRKAVPMSLNYSPNA